MRICAIRDLKKHPCFTKEWTHPLKERDVVQSDERVDEFEDATFHDEAVLILRIGAMILYIINEVSGSDFRKNTRR